MKVVGEATDVVELSEVEVELMVEVEVEVLVVDVELVEVEVEVVLGAGGVCEVRPPGISYAAAHSSRSIPSGQQ